MRHRKVFLSLAILLVAILVLASCATAPAPAPAPAPMPTEKVTWRFQAYSPNLSSERVQEYIITNVFPKVLERTGGNFDIQTYYYGELGIGWNQNPQVVGKGVVEMSHTYGGYHLGDLPLAGYSELPMISVEGNLADFKTVHDLFGSRVRTMYRDAYGAEVVMSGIYTWSEPMMTKPFPDMLDWGGLKVRTPGAGMGDFVEAMGGVNVYTAWAEMYQAMKLGTIDGVFTSIRATISENLWEQMTHIYEFRVLTGEHYTFVNPEALAALPAEYRQILLEELAIAEQGLWDLIIPVDIPGDEVIEFALSKGIEVVYPSQEVLQAMQDKVKPLWEQWAMDNGPMARDMLNEIYDVFGIAR